MKQPAQLSADGVAFLIERHLATYSSIRSDGTPHVTPVGFTWDAERQLVRIITSRTSRKAHHAIEGGAVAICQLDGRRWLTLEGNARVTTEPAAIAEAVARYAARYREPRENPARIAIEVSVNRLLGSVAFFSS